MTQTIDFTEKFVEGRYCGSFGCIRAEAKENNVLILIKLEKGIKRFDGKTGKYRLEYRSLSKGHNIDNQVDIDKENFVFAFSQDFTYWTVEEVKQWENKSLFDCVNLF